MWPYIFNLGIILIIYVLVNSCAIIKNKRNTFINLSFLYMSLFLGLRSVNTGPDSIVYIDIFKYIAKLPIDQLNSINWEVLYIIFNKILSLFTTNTQIYIIITSVLGLIGPFILIKKYSKNSFLSIVLFITLGFFSYYIFTIRQCIAITILVFSVKYIQEKKFIKFILIVIIATLVHKSSIVFALIYFISKVKFTKKVIPLYAVMCVILFFIKDVLMNLVINTIYPQYVLRSIGGEGVNLLIFMLVLLVITFMMIYYGKINIKYKDDDEKISIDNICMNIFLFTICLQVLATGRDIVARFITVTYMFIIILIPNLISMLDNKKEKRMYEFIIFSIGLAFYIYQVVNYIGTSMEYSFFI